jgi:hypothetical protein
VHQPVTHTPNLRPGTSRCAWRDSSGRSSSADQMLITRILASQVIAGSP